MKTYDQDLRRIKWPLYNPDTGNVYVPCVSVPRTEDGWDFAQADAAIGEAEDVGRFAFIRLAPPRDARELARLLEALIWRYRDRPSLYGVDVVLPEGELTDEDAALCADAWAEALIGAFKFVREGSREERLLAGRCALGYITDDDEAGKHWHEAPYRAKRPGPHIALVEAEDLRASYLPSPAGHRYELLHIDARLFEGDRCEIDFTMANTGDVPCYTPGRFRIRLQGTNTDGVREYDTDFRAQDVAPGEEKVFSRVCDIRGLPHGEYMIHIGLFFDGTGYPSSFGIEGRISDGYYEGLILLEL